nr:hypothetical protein [Fredinandcohnia onubensis]
MKKILTLNNDEKSDLLIQLNEKLKTKNRLLKLIIMNPDKNAEVLERSKKQRRYEEQIYLLGSIKDLVLSSTNRQDIQRINSMIEYYRGTES